MARQKMTELMNGQSNEVPTHLYVVFSLERACSFYSYQHRIEWFLFSAGISRSVKGRCAKPLSVVSTYLQEFILSLFAQMDIWSPPSTVPLTKHDLPLVQGLSPQTSLLAGKAIGLNCNPDYSMFMPCPFRAGCWTCLSFSRCKVIDPYYPD